MMLDVNHVYKTFHPGTINERRALAGVDLHLEEGDFVTVIGGNGAGKSTLLNGRMARGRRLDRHRRERHHRSPGL